MSAAERSVQSPGERIHFVLTGNRGYRPVGAGAFVRHVARADSPPPAAPQSGARQGTRHDQAEDAGQSADSPVQLSMFSLYRAARVYKPPRLRTLAAHVADMPALAALLGIDSGGAPLLIRLPAADVGHLLIRGRSQSGKTALARTIASSLAMFTSADDMQLILIDPIRKGFGALRALPNVLGNLVFTPDETMDCLRWVGGEMVRRERTQDRQSALIVLIDRLDEVVATASPRLRPLLAQLILRGAGVGIHVVACATTRMLADCMKDLGAEFPVHIVGPAGEQDELYLAGRHVSHGDQAPACIGEFSLVAGSEALPFRAAWIGRKELNEVANLLHTMAGEPVDWRAWPFVDDQVQGAAITRASDLVTDGNDESIHGMPGAAPGRHGTGRAGFLRDLLALWSSGV